MVHSEKAFALGELEAETAPKCSSPGSLFI